MNAPSPIVSVTPTRAAESGGSVSGTSAVHSRTATIASVASSRTISAIATEETIGEDAAISTSASRNGAGKPRGASAVTAAQTRTGEMPSSQTTSSAAVAP